MGHNIDLGCKSFNMNAVTPRETTKMNGHSGFVVKMLTMNCNVLCLNLA